MKRFLKIALLVLIITFGCISVALEFGGNTIGLFSGLKYLGVFCLFCFSIPVFIIERDNYYKKNRKLKEFTITVIGGVFFTIVLSQHIKRAIIERTGTEMKFVNLSNTFDEKRIEFKKGNDFKLTEFSSWEMTVYYGKYIKTGDTLKIISSNYDGKKKGIPGIGIIKEDTLFWIKADTMLLEK